MTPEQQRIAIAEWAGWTELRDGRYKKDGVVERFFPDYLNDLDAVHELEKKLTNEEFQFFDGLLLEIVSRDYVTKTTGRMVDRASTHATAAQRCEALLKTLNLWTP